MDFLRNFKVAFKIALFVRGHISEVAFKRTLMLKKSEKQG